MYKKERKKVWPYVARGRVYLATRSHPRRQGWRKKCILSPFARILDPSLPFYLFPPSSLLSLSRLFSLLLPQEQRIMLFRFAYTFHRLLLYIPFRQPIFLPDSRRANRILSFHLSLFPVPFVRLIANYRKK